MTYCITFYCRSGGSTADQALDRVVADSRSLGGVQLCAIGRASGDGWAEVNLGSTPEYAEFGTVRLELHTADALVRKMIEPVSIEGMAQRIDDADMVAILTLSGADVDWSAVRGVWISMTKIWQAIPYDDVSGFDVSIESLG